MAGLKLTQGYHIDFPRDASVVDAALGLMLALIALPSLWLTQNKICIRTTQNLPQAHQRRHHGLKQSVANHLQLLASPQSAL